MHQRIADTLGWSLADVQSFSLAALRELLPEGKLRAEVGRMIQSGEVIICGRRDK